MQPQTLLFSFKLLLPVERDEEKAISISVIAHLTITTIEIRLDSHLNVNRVLAYDGLQCEN